MVTENDKVRKAYRQGELLFLPLNEEDTAKIGHVPKSASYPCWNALKTNVLREGEATGHKHEVLTRTPGMAYYIGTLQHQLLRGLANMDLVGSEDRMLVADEPVEIVPSKTQAFESSTGYIPCDYTARIR